MTRVRGDIYLSPDVWRWLRILAKCDTAPGSGQIVTKDEVADQILRQAIREQHPSLAEHAKEIDKLEKQLIAKLNAERNLNDMRKPVSTDDALDDSGVAVLQG